MTYSRGPLKLRGIRLLIRSLAGLWLVLACLVSSLPGQTPAPTVTAFPVQGDYAISNIVTGSNNALWFITANFDTTAYYANNVAPSGTNTPYSLASVASNSYPVGNSITAGPDGALWFMAGRSASAVLCRITTAGVITTVAIPGGTAFANGSGAITTGPDGNLWFTDATNAQVWKYNPSLPATSAFTHYGLASPGFGITAGPDGNLWLTEYVITSQESGATWSGQVAKVTTSGTVTQYPLPQQNVQVSSTADTFATGPDGALWFTEYNGGMIGRVTTAGAVTTVYTGLVNGIANGGDGNLWFTQPYNDLNNVTQSLVKLTTAGVTTPYALNSSQFTAPLGITLGPGGGLWFDDGSGPSVGRAALPLAIDTASLPGGSYGVAYNSTLQAHGGLTPYAWSWTAAASSTLPPGLTLSGAGMIGGTPTATGAFTVNVQLSDNETPAQTATKQFSIAIVAGSASGVTVSSGSGQSASISTAFASPLVAKVTDGGGAPVANVNVTFTAPGSGASGSFGTAGTTATAATNSSGLATSPVLIANSTAGGFTVNATVSGVTAPAPFALTNTAGTAAAITATSGGGQTAPINSAFASPLIATLKDSGGNPVANATVTFTAPGSGASGTFPGGAASATATTNSAGVATSPTLTANSNSGGFTVNATAAGVSAPAAFALTNAAGTATTITATSGGGQSAQIGNAFASPLVVTVTDQGGNPVANATVTFTAPGSGASGTFNGATTASVTTNGSGVATAPTFTANATVGSYNVSAGTAGVNNSSTFALTNTPGGPASIAVSSGSGQSVQVGGNFGAPLVAVVKDAGGNAVANATVTFSAPGSGATATFGGSATATANTNAQGMATSPGLTASQTTGTFSISASVSGLGSSATFTLTNTAGPAASIAASAGTPQTAQINNTFGSTLQVVVKDSFGNLVSGASVTFSAPGSGASATFAGSTTVTTVSGVASSPAVTANSAAGNYTVSASVANVGGQALFSLTNTAGGPASITASGGGGQSASAATAFAAPLTALVKDSGGNVVANANVTFTAPASGPSGAFPGNSLTAMVATNAAGAATSPTFTANGSAGGPYNVTATVQGASGSAAFALTNTAGAPASITATGGTGQFAKINTTFVSPLTATVNDANGNPVGNVTVTFSMPGSGVSGTFPGGGATANVQTSGAGVAVSPTITANGTAGAFIATASVGGAGTPASYGLNNSAGPPGSITATSGGGQSAQVNKAFGNPFVVTVVDSSNNPVANATVTFSAPGSGPSGAFAGGGTTATANTSGSGVATSPTFTANGNAGSYSVTASVSGAAAPAAFSVSNTAGTPASITASSGGGQSARINSQFNNALVVTVNDGTGNPVGGVAVTFGAPSTGASGTFAGAGATATATTSNTGVATSPVFTANGTTGSYNVTGSVSGVTGQATFALTNVAGLTITTTTLPDGTAGLQYSQILTSVGGTAPYNWTITKGTLPTGLSLDPKAGAITGIPTANGTYPFTVGVTDSTNQSATPQDLSVFINPPAATGVVPVFTITGLPANPTLGANITTATINLDQPSALAYTGTLSVSFTPNSVVAGLPQGYTGDSGFIVSGAKTTTTTVQIDAGQTSVPIPAFDPGTVAGDVTVNLVVGQTASTPAVVTIPATAPVIEANSVQIVSVTSTGFSVELVATSTTRDLKNATFTFAAASGSSITGSSSFTVDVSSILSSWFSSNTSYQYGGAFSLTIPFTLSGSSSAISSVGVTVSNSVGTSTAVSGAQ